MKWQRSLLLGYLLKRQAKFFTGFFAIDLLEGFVVVVCTWFWVREWLDMLKYVLWKADGFANITSVLSTLLNFKEIVTWAAAVIHKLRKLR